MTKTSATTRRKSGTKVVRTAQPDTGAAGSLADLISEYRSLNQQVKLLTEQANEARNALLTRWLDNDQRDLWVTWSDKSKTRVTFSRTNSETMSATKLTRLLARLFQSRKITAAERNGCWTPNKTYISGLVKHGRISESEHKALFVPCNDDPTWRIVTADFPK